MLHSCVNIEYIHAVNENGGAAAVATLRCYCGTNKGLTYITLLLLIILP